MNATTIAILGVVILVVTLAIVYGPNLWRQMQSSRLAKTGIEAPATIVEVSDTGNRYNYTPEVRIKLLVQPKDIPPYQAEIKMVASPAAMARLSAGAPVRVKYDPRKPSLVAIIP